MWTFWSFQKWNSPPGMYTMPGSFAQSRAAGASSTRDAGSRGGRPGLHAASRRAKRAVEARGRIFMFSPHPSAQDRRFRAVCRAGGVGSARVLVRDVAREAELLLSSQRREPADLA